MKKTTSRWFSTRPQAKQFHARLVVAANDGVRFSSDTLLPADWDEVPSHQMYDVAHRWIQAQFPSWVPKTRDSAIEVVCDAVLAMVDPKAKKPISADLATLRRNIKDWLAGLIPGGKRITDTCSTWLRTYSVETRVLDAQYCSSIHTQITTTNGRLKAASVVQRYRANMRALFVWGITARYFQEQLWPSAPKRRKATTVKSVVRDDLLPSPAEARACIDLVPTHQPGSHSHRIILAIVLYAGLRPGEARALTIQDCTLPETGWGTAVLSSAATGGRKRSTMPGQDVDVPKTGEREVPLAPVVVALIREHIGTRVEGLIGLGARGGMVSDSNLDCSWARVRTKSNWRVYDLRHTCAMVLIGTGAPFAEVARRMGHSPEELFHT